ncbi:MAG: calcium/sodium antiporter [Myxococcaceae bacterium]|nr:calcium/sodium antiporter [Myxococcaceae bacterium]
MALDLARLAAGIALLYFGAEWLVRGASGIAKALGVRPLVIGLTVVAYGTSMPELVVSTLAALDGKSDITLGNVVGSNVANLGFILGLTAIIKPPEVDGALIRRELPVMVGAAMLVPLLLWDGVVTRIEGALLLLGAFGFTVLLVRTAKQLPETSRLGDQAEAEPEGPEPRSKLWVLAIAGLAALVAGGKVFVDGAVSIALSLGMSERLVGLTIVAVGTSLPELAASVVAALRGQSSLAIGNVVGSNIFNVLLILGGASVVSPVSGQLDTLKVDLGVLVLLSVAATAMMTRRRLITRLEGGLLVVAYGTFLFALAFA